MSTVNPISGPQLPRVHQGGVPLAPSPEKVRQKFDLSIALTLSTWSALTLAVQNSWGGPNSSEKRDWFAGAISDLVEATPDADVEYMEEFLLQVMNDEFDVNVEDGSGEEVAAKIVGLRKLTARGEFGMVDEMFVRWQERQRGGDVGVRFVEGRGEEEGEVTEGDSDSVDEEDEEEDTEMGDAPAAGNAPAAGKAPREEVQPVVDEDGFTKVVGKKKR